jgi:hypothetical protein
MLRIASVSFIVLGALATGPARADEGMWPFNLYPVEAIQKKHDVKISPALLDKAMKSSVRFNNGGSGSFVSRDGLVMTNQHVAQDCLGKLSEQPGAPNIAVDGYLARGTAEERRCPDLELNVLQKIDDVTAPVEEAAKGASDDAERNAKRKAAMAKLEKACADASGMRCDVVTLYGGGMYHLYTYKKYTDVRLTFAPEFQIAFFGGDPDNFTYPRNALDVTFFRVYEADQPAQVAHFLPFSARGPIEGDPVFVSGHPGSTDRFTALAKLEGLRDVTYPLILQRYAALRDVYAAYIARGPTEKRAAHEEFVKIENSLKAIGGFQGGLLDKELMAELKRRQDDLIVKVNALPDAAERDRLLEAWPRLEKAYASSRSYARQLFVLERQLAPFGQLASIARHLVRLADELPKKSEDRLREYRDSNLASLELSLFSEAAIEPSLEVEKIAFGLSNMELVLGKRDAVVRAALVGKSARARASEVVAGSRLADVAVRRALYERLKKGEGSAALDEAKDPLIELVRSYDQAARALRKRFEDEVEGAERTYNGRIAEAMGKVYGTSVYPDATFTLRISTGVVKGYVEDGKPVAWRTAFGDLYRKHKRHGGKEPYHLPQRWADRMSSVDFTVPFNFVSTNDIIGGNSGSPVWNERGQVVGLIFDGNIQSLPNRFLYDEKQARAVSVAANGILHALERVYGARHIVDELLPVAAAGSGE